MEKYNYYQPIDNYVLDTVISVINEFYILSIDDRLEIYHQNGDVPLRKIKVDKVQDNDGYLIMDCYMENARVILSVEDGIFGMLIIFNNKTDKFDFYFQFQIKESRKLNPKKFKKDHNFMKNININDDGSIRITTEFMKWKN